MLKKISASILALVMVLSLCAGAMADTTLGTAGEQGAFTQPDKPVGQSKALKLEKELKVYNLDEAKVNAPTITYEYKVEAGTADKSGTDKADKHDPAGSVTAPTKEGIVVGVKINDGTAAAEDTDKTITWESDKPDFASVDANGKVTAKAQGIAVITAKSGGKEAKCTVTVVNDNTEGYDNGNGAWDD